MNSYHIFLRLSQSDDSAIFRPKYLFDKFPSRKQPESSKNGKVKTGKTTNDWRFGPISVDWADCKQIDTSKEENMSGMNRDEKSGPATARFLEKSMQTGTAELPEGVVHVYRSDTYVEVGEAGDTQPSVSTKESGDGTILAVLAVPSHMTPSDFLTFVAPAAESMAHLRMIRDSLPNRSMVVIKFRTTEDARDFAAEYNGKEFNAMEPEICHVVNVLSVEIEANDATSLAISRLAIAQSSMHELPTCPVCLERMDASVTGLVTVPCSHTFHCACLSKWGDSRCPVCRYSQTLLTSHPTRRSSVENRGPSLSVCFDCSSTTNLWICLICGNVGCGRYGRAHAHAHYQLTTHLYSLELETQRVWDYAGDGYVHRLIQNKADGKLVELPSATMNINDSNGSRLGPGPTDTMNAEKMEAIGIEYSYLLKSTMDSQRNHYEEEKAHVEQLLVSAREKITLLEKDLEARREAEREEDERRRKQEDVLREEMTRERVKMDKKVDKLTEVAKTLEKELKEERAVSQGMWKNLQVMKEKATTAHQEKAALETRMKDLEEQLRDVMIYLDVKNKVEQEGGLEEAAGGSIVIPPSSSKKKRTKK
ncbi:BRCA1-associated protein 2-domain-containing protein [Hysterangium stoloniferum]|nr:BRCA1-associated protein 2-domain-containing protein [Hysterangium stoloniferum]